MLLTSPSNSKFFHSKLDIFLPSFHSFQLMQPIRVSYFDPCISPLRPSTFCNLRASPIRSLSSYFSSNDRFLCSNRIGSILNRNCLTFPSTRDFRFSFRMHDNVHFIFSNNSSIQRFQALQTSSSNEDSLEDLKLSDEENSELHTELVNPNSSDSVFTESLPDSSLVVASFYNFASLPDCEELRKPIKELCEKNFVSGGIILAPEGINGSICGRREAIDAVLAGIRSDPRLSGMRHVEAPAGPCDVDIHSQVTGQSEHSPLAAGPDSPFRWDHVRVKLKNEIVTLGMPHINPTVKVGKYVKPKDWNALISDPDTIVIDVRNHYEIRIGKFKGAIDPDTISFREFPKWINERILKRKEEGVEPNLHHESSVLASEKNEFQEKVDEGNDRVNEGVNNHMNHHDYSNKKIAMYCTGGIRCEKATALLRHQGIDEVYHLEGGILKYLEEVSPEESLWEGECFVFDKRVSVDSGLKQGSYHLCYSCKGPVTEEDMASPLWEDGVSCPHCYHVKSEEEKDRARARQNQFQVWGKIGGPHGGKKELIRKKGEGKNS